MIKLFLFQTIFYFAFGEIVNLQQLSVPRTFLGGTSLPNQGLILFAGGLNNNNPTNAVDIYNVKMNTWTTSELSVAREYVSATSLPNLGLAFFAGGDDANQNYFSTVDIFNASSNRWTTMQLSVPRTQIGSCSLPEQNLVLFAGGVNLNLFDSPLCATVDIYNATSNQLTIGTLSVARTFLASTSLPNLGLAFFAGGSTSVLLGSQVPFPTNAVDIFNAIGNYWTTAQLSTLSSSLTATSLPDQGFVFFAGGETNGPTFIDTIDIFNAFTKQWTTSKLTLARTTLSSSSLPKQGLAFFAGGQNSNNEFVIDVYDSKTGKITGIVVANQITGLAGASLPDVGLVLFAGGSRNNGQSAMVNGYGYCLGGFTTINPTICQTCPSGFSCPFVVTPIECPTGSYCPINNSNPIACPEGTYNPIKKLQSVDQCTKCLAGTYNNQIGQSLISNCLDCPFGNYCPMGSPNAIPCPINYYCPTSTQKIACPSGTYNDFTSSLTVDNCKKCLLGHFCSGNGASPAACLPGTYSKEVGTSICSNCPEGYSCQLGSENPLICPKNTISSKGSGVCTPCPSGQYTTEDGSSTCLTCSGGQFEIKGWFCMTITERFVFCFIWIGSIYSGYNSIKKVNELFMQRKNKLRDAGIKFTWKRFFFIEDAMKEEVRMIKIQQDNEIPKSHREEMDQVKEIIITLQNRLKFLEEK